MTEQTTAVAIPVQGATSVLTTETATPDQVIRYSQKVREMIRDSLERGKDYGRIPKTENDTLYKRGAELICKTFGASGEYELLEVEKDHNFECFFKDKYGNKRSSYGLYRYVYKCKIMKDGDVLGQSDASCSSLESKYIYNPRNNENTVVKMSQKRAFVGAILNAFALSDRFSQEDDDLPKAGDTKVIYNETLTQKAEFKAKAKKLGVEDKDMLAKISAACVGLETNVLDNAIKEYLEENK